MNIYHSLDSHNGNPVKNPELREALGKLHSGQTGQLIYAGLFSHSVSEQFIISLANSVTHRPYTSDKQTNFLTTKCASSITVSTQNVWRGQPMVSQYRVSRLREKDVFRTQFHRSCDAESSRSDLHRRTQVQHLHVRVVLEARTMSVARILFKNVIRRVFAECAHLDTVEWIAPEVPIFQICRELASLRMKSLSIRLGCHDPTETQGVQSQTHTWYELRQLHIQTHFCRGCPQFHNTGVFHTLSNDVLPRLQDFSYHAQDWDEDVEKFLAQCLSLEVLVLSCIAIPLDLQLPSFQHLCVLGIQASSIFQILPWPLLNLQMIVLLDFSDVQRSNHSMRHRALERLTRALNNIVKHEHLTNLKEIVIADVSANVVVHFEWDEELVSKMRLHRAVTDLKAINVQVKDSKYTCMLFPFVFYPEPGVGEL